MTACTDSHRKAAAGFRRELAGFADAKDTHYAGAPLPRTRVDPKQSIPSTNRPLAGAKAPCFLSSLLACASESARRDPTQPPMMCARSARRSRLPSQPMTLHRLPALLGPRGALEQEVRQVLRRALVAEETAHLPLRLSHLLLGEALVRAERADTHAGHLPPRPRGQVAHARQRELAALGDRGIQLVPAPRGTVQCAVSAPRTLGGQPRGRREALGKRDVA
jgi:hypothetical protein